MIAVTFKVENKPPYKQTPEGEAECNRQAERRDALQQRARAAFGPLRPLKRSVRCAVSIYYSRKKGKADSGNIVGGVLDALQCIAFKNDSQVAQISYIEWSGSRDWYQVTVSELARDAT